MELDRLEQSQVVHAYHTAHRWPMLANLEDELRRLEPLADDPDFQRDRQAVKIDSKRVLARLIEERTGVIVDPNSLFDIQVKRLHDYKRQHLNVLYLVTPYNRLRHAFAGVVTPREVIFGGKAAPAYRMAKLIIKLVNSVVAVVNQLLADYRAYVDCQERVSYAYSDPNAWMRMSILNTARVGHFSSDRSIRKHCRHIWKVTPIISDERDA